MTSLADEIDAVAWDRLRHARGVATDTPGHLRALLGADRDAQLVAVRHLNSSVIDAGTPWPAAGPVIVILGRILAERTMTGGDVLRFLLYFLRQSARVTSDTPQTIEQLRTVAATMSEQELCEARRADLDLPDFHELHARINLYDAIPRALENMLPFVESASDDPYFAILTLSCAEALARHATTRHLHPRLAESAWRLAEREDVGVRAIAVFALGRLGGDPRAFLTDPWLAVRGCAAIAPALAGEPAAHDVLVQLITVPRAFEADLPDAPLGQGVVGARDVIEAACSNVADPARLIPGLAVVPLHGDIHAYLRRFFASGWPSVADRTSGQWHVARRIADDDGFWSPAGGWHQSTVFRELGLPVERDVWRAFADVPKRQGDYTADDLVVLEAGAAVRRHPGSWFGTSGAGLARAIVERLDAAYEAAAVEHGGGRARVAVEDATRFCLSVSGHAFPTDRLEAIMSGRAIGGSAPAPLDQLSLTAAMCSEVTLTTFTAGQATAQRFVSGTALGPPVLVAVPADTLPAAADPIGYRLAFTLDPDLLPPDDQLTVTA